jgi:CubicO group peptidase (beta-lactamase class C family)
MVYNAIEKEYFPGAQLLIGTDEEVLYKKSYGKFTYDNDSKSVDDNSVFDLASLTKVIATTSAIMKLYDEGKLDLYDRVAYYIPEFGVNDKETITIQNLLLHNSGLKPWIPFYQTCETKQEAMDMIYNLELSYEPETEFVYSDLNAILLGEIVEKVSNQSLDEYCRENIFKPLKMLSTAYNPDDEMKKKIPPTEYDSRWRNKLLKGEVHDEAAYLIGGVSGNAGLFSNAEDIYTLMSTLLNGGTYYNPYSRALRTDTMFKERTVGLFTDRYPYLSYYNTRALGWDTKPEPINYRIPCGELISDSCFGHTGYTGTSAWCDKNRKLIIVFLTNRVYPSRSHKGIRDFRPELHNKIIELYSK